MAVVGTLPGFELCEGFSGLMLAANDLHYTCGNVSSNVVTDYSVGSFRFVVSQKDTPWPARGWQETFEPRSLPDTLSEYH